MTLSLEKSLARRAVACSAWSYLPGCRIIDSFGICGTVTAIITPDKDCLDIAWDDGCLNRCQQSPDDVIPDFSEPATLGCLLFLVRKEWNQSNICTVDMQGYDGFDWICVVEAPGHRLAHNDAVWFLGNTEIECLIAALEDVSTCGETHE